MDMRALLDEQHQINEALKASKVRRPKVERVEAPAEPVRPSGYLSVAQIKELLAEAGIEFDPKAKRADLLELLP